MHEVAEDRLQAYQTHNHLSLHHELSLDLLLCVLSGFRSALYRVPEADSASFRGELERACRFVLAFRVVSVSCARLQFPDLVSDLLAIPASEPQRVFSTKRPAVLSRAPHESVENLSYEKGFSLDYNPYVIHQQLGREPWGNDVLDALQKAAETLPEGFVPPPPSFKNGATIVLLEHLDAAAPDLQKGILELIQGRRALHLGEVRQVPENILFVATTRSAEAAELNSRLVRLFISYT